MLNKFITVIAFCILEYSAISNGKQINYQSSDTADTEPTLSIVGLGLSNVTFRWTKKGAWEGVDDFTVSILSREGDYRPIDINASFTQFTDIFGNNNDTQSNFFCEDDFCVCRFNGHLGLFGPYYKSCSDGVVIVEANDFSLTADFTTAPPMNLEVLSEVDGNNLIVHWNGFKNTDDDRCGRDILLNIYQPVDNPGFTPMGWYWPGSEFYGNILHQMNISADSNWENEYSFSLDPNLVTNDVKTESAAVVLAYMEGDVVTNTWAISTTYYEGNSQSPGASISAVTILVAALLSLTFN